MHSLLQENKKIYVNPEIIARAEGNDDIILYNRQTGAIHFVNLYGMAVLGLCCLGHSKHEIISIIKEEMGETPEGLNKVQSLLDDLIRHEVLSEGVDFTDNKSKTQQTELPKLSNIYLYVTDQCNLFCKHCWVSPVKNSSRYEQTKISLEDLKRVITEAIDMGLNNVKITGGEPFLWHDISDLLKFLHEKKIEIGIETNGTLITSDIADMIMRVNVKSVGVSIDAADPTIHDYFRGVKGSHSAALKGLKLLLANGIHTGVIMSVYKENIFQIELLLSLLSAFDIEYVKFNPITPTGRGKILKEDGLLLSDMEVKEEIIDKISFWEAKFGIPLVISYPTSYMSFSYLKKGNIGICPFHSLLSILANGDISFCGFGYSEPQWIMGNIWNTDIKELWKNHPLILEARENIPSKFEGVCAHCILKWQCKGHCRALAVEVCNSLIASDSSCQNLYDAGLFPRYLLDYEYVPLRKY